jgi:hypothetical protein
MKNALYILLFLSTTVFGQYKDGKYLLRAMHTKYAGNYCQTVTFDQKTTRFDSTGAIRDTSYWYEWISYPDKFRIDFGKKYGGNCVVFKNDSAYNYRNHKLLRKYRDENDLLLLLGGMYFRPIDSVLARLVRVGYVFEIRKNTSPASYTIGAAGGPQVTVDAKDLKVISIKTKLSETDWLEIKFDEFKRSCKGFTETKVSGYRNGKLEQKEVYLGLKTNIAIPDSIFNKK